MVRRFKWRFSLAVLVPGNGSSSGDYAVVWSSFDVMRNLGSSAREFRKGLEDGKDAVNPNKPVEGTQANQSVADKADDAPKQES